MLSLSEVVQATGARVHPPADPDRLPAIGVRGVSTDTRTLRPGDLFVALRGPRTDGHSFIAEAMARGAVAVLAATLPASMAPASEASAAVEATVPVLLVDDTLRALGLIAARYRQRLRAEVVGITGSVGKTTTVALAASVLAQRYRVVPSEESWNAEIGVPLTVLRAGQDTEVIVTEMAMRGLGQIRELVEIARPRIGVVTNVGESHLELLGTSERIAQAKGELVEGLPPDGVAVLNADDPAGQRLAALAGCRVVWFGESASAEVRAEEVAAAGRAMTFRLILGGEDAQVRLPLPGRHNVANALAGAAVGMVLGVPADAVRIGLERAGQPSRRLQVEEAGSLLILDDTYNASPRSVRAALDVLDQIAGDRRRVAVLGDMKELGPASRDLHREIGREAATRGIALIVAVGPEAEALAEGAREVLAPDRVVHVPDREAALLVMQARVRPDDVVLVKGSRAMALEAVVEALRSHAGVRS
jgi:UDP-N-acetylmuramoyl-tripeptide--D-alanyl-D-alanine ligase